MYELNVKLKKIRIFRNMTQKELGIALGFTHDPQARIAQYETGYRIPKDSVIKEMARVLNVHPYALSTKGLPLAIYLMEEIFWLDTEEPGSAQMACPEHESWDPSFWDPTDEYCYQSCFLPPALFQDAPIREYLLEFSMRQEELAYHVITPEEYMEWKLQWPDSRDHCRQQEPLVQWRKSSSNGSRK